MRIKSAVVSIVEFVQFIKSCLEWENPVRCCYIFALETSFHTKFKVGDLLCGVHDHHLVL